MVELPPRLVVATERATAAKNSGADILQRLPAARRFDIHCIEVHKMRRIDARVRIVTRGARSLRVDYVKSVPAVLSLQVGRFKTLIAENAVAAVAFIAKGLIGGAFGIVVVEDQLPLQ